MAGQTTVTMVLADTTTQDEGQTDPPEACLLLQLDVGNTLTDNEIPPRSHRNRHC